MPVLLAVRAHHKKRQDCGGRKHRVPILNGALQKRQTSLGAGRNALKKQMAKTVTSSMLNSKPKLKNCSASKGT